MFPIFFNKLRKDTMENSQATIISSIILYNIARDLGEEEHPLPDHISTEEFDRLMARAADDTPARIRDQNYYIRDQVVNRYFARQIR